MVGTSISKFDEVGIRLVAMLPAALRPFFELMSYIGHPVTTCSIGFLIVIYGIFKQRPVMAVSGSVVWLALLISTALKNLTERARPLTEYVANMQVQSFSFPSGHTTGSTVAFGLLGYYCYHLLPTPYKYIAPACFGLLILLVGVSRIYLGAHFPSDVAGGWLLGGAILFLAILAIRALQ